MRYKLYDRFCTSYKWTPDWVKKIAEKNPFFDDIIIADTKEKVELCRLNGSEYWNIKTILDLLNEKEKRIENLENELWGAGYEGYWVNDPVVRKKLDDEWLLRNPDWKSNPDIISVEKGETNELH